MPAARKQAASSKHEGKKAQTNLPLVGGKPARGAPFPQRYSLASRTSVREPSNPADLPL